MEPLLCTDCEKYFTRLTSEGLCADCEEKAIDDERYCPGKNDVCGYLVPKNSRLCPFCLVDSSPLMVLCTKCGKRPAPKAESPEIDPLCRLCDRDMKGKRELEIAEIIFMIHPPQG